MNQESTWNSQYPKVVNNHSIILSQSIERTYINQILISLLP